MRETFIILHLAPSGPRLETVDDHRRAVHRAHALAAEGGQVLLLTGNAIVLGAPPQPTALQMAIGAVVAAAKEGQ